MTIEIVPDQPRCLTRFAVRRAYDLELFTKLEKLLAEAATEEEVEAGKALDAFVDQSINGYCPDDDPRIARAASLKSGSKVLGHLLAIARSVKALNKVAAYELASQIPDAYFTDEDKAKRPDPPTYNSHTANQTIRALVAACDFVGISSDKLSCLLPRPKVGSLH